jgi:hypothetical protein
MSAFAATWVKGLILNTGTGFSILIYLPNKNPKIEISVLCGFFNAEYD